MPIMPWPMRASRSAIPFSPASLITGWFRRACPRPWRKRRLGAPGSSDGRLAAGHSALACILKNYHWDWESSEREYRQAISLNPNYPRAHHSYADLLAALGRFDEALAQIEAAHDIDPFSVAINTDFGFIHYLTRDYAAPSPACGSLWNCGRIIFPRARS